MLGQHRTIWQEHSAKDFASYESYKRAGISVSKKSFRHAVRIFKLSKKFKNTCRLNEKGAFCPLHTSPAALSQTFSARFFDNLNTVVFPPFITARMGQKIGRRPQTQLCGDALNYTGGVSMFRRYEDEPRERAEKFDGGWERALTKKAGASDQSLLRRWCS